MSTFIVITLAMLILASECIILTDKAEQNGHSDKGGRFYILMIWVLCIMYTFQNVMFRLNGTV